MLSRRFAEFIFSLFLCFRALCRNEFWLLYFAFLECFLLRCSSRRCICRPRQMNRRKWYSVWSKFKNRIITCSTRKNPFPIATIKSHNLHIYFQIWNAFIIVKQARAFDAVDSGTTKKKLIYYSVEIRIATVVDNKLEWTDLWKGAALYRHGFENQQRLDIIEMCGWVTGWRMCLLNRYILCFRHWWCMKNTLPCGKQTNEHK